MHNLYAFCRSITQLINAETLCCQKQRSDVGFLKYSNSVTSIKNTSFILDFNSLARILLGRIFFNKKYILILGDLRWLPNVIKVMVYFSEEIWLVDDGIVTLWFHEVYKNRFKFNKRINYFTKYKSLLPNFNYIKLQKLIENINDYRRENAAFIFGMSPPQLGISKEIYIGALKRLIIDAKASCQKIYYFPHPKEKIDWIEGEIIVVEGGEIVEDKIKKIKFLPSRYYGFYSSAMIDCFVNDGKEPGRYHFLRIPGFEKRGNRHGFDFDVEMKIYQLFMELGFKEIK